MNVSIHQMEKLLHGQYTFKQWAFSMLLTQLKTKYAVEPTQANLELCTNEMNTFLDKYQAILAHDFSIIDNI